MSVLMSIPCEFEVSSITDVTEINSSFASGTLKVMYLGDNRNKTHFTKAAVEKALPSLRNVPIVCHWDDEAETIGGHDIALVSDSSGSLRIKNLTEPCGVVPDHAKFSFQKFCDSDGVTHEYLVISDVILWKRQDVYRHIVNDLGGVVKHSMEINVNESGETPNGLMDITDFEFTALCLLETCEPCFQGSELELYSAQNFKQKMEQMMLEMKETFNKIDTSNEDDNIHPQKYSTEGGNEALDEKMELVAKYGIDVETLDFSIEDFTVEELTEKFEAMKASAEGEPEDKEPTVKEAPAEEGDTEQDKFALTSNIVDELRMELDKVTVEREWGACARYWYADCDLEAKEVYCWDTEDWLLYGFTYTVDGDNIVIDFECKKRKKYVIADFDEGEQKSPFAEAFTLLEGKLHESAEWEAKYNKASGTITSMEAELGELRQFKSDTEEKADNEAKKKLFSDFTDLDGVEDFEALRADMKKYDIAVLEEKCYAIRGRNGAPLKFSLESKAPKLPVDKTEVSKEPYGGLFTEFGIG